MPLRTLSGHFVVVGAVVVVVLGGCSSSVSGNGSTVSAASTTSVADGELKIGTLLPQTGSLAFLGPPEFAAVDLAINDINAAGGVLGKPVTEVKSDSGDTSTRIASSSVDRMLTDHVDAIIGAASSAVSKTVIDKITGAGVLQFSPANTSPDFTDYPDHGLYFRTAPSDLLQGRVLGDLILGDGAQEVMTMARRDVYGTGLAAIVATSVTSGRGAIVKQVTYDPEAASFSAEVAQIKAANPDAIALIAFGEAVKIVPEMIKQGIDLKKVYFVDGDLADYRTDFAKGTLTGAKGTMPGVAASAAFKKRLLRINPKLVEFSSAAQTYDAVVLAALAAQEARSDAGVQVAAHLVDVSRGGTKCTSFAGCVRLVRAGTNVDYDGLSGPIEFSDQGEPTEATIGIYQYRPDNSYALLESKAGKL